MQYLVEAALVSARRLGRRIRLRRAVLQVESLAVDVDGADRGAGIAAAMAGVVRSRRRDLKLQTDGFLRGTFRLPRLKRQEL